jgi:hypothetical protein
MSSRVIPPTHGDVAFDIALDGCEGGRTQQIYVFRAEGVVMEWLRQEAKTPTYRTAPRDPRMLRETLECRRRRRLWGHLRKTCLGMNAEPTKAPKQAAILSEDVHTDLDGIEVGSHVRWEGISLSEESDGGLTTRSVRLFPIWDGNLAAVPLSLDPMPHADSALVPEGLTTRQQFWDHVHEQLVHLLADQRAWVRRFLVC